MYVYFLSNIQLKVISERCEFFENCVGKGYLVEFLNGIIAQQENNINNIYLRRIF